MIRKKLLLGTAGVILTGWLLWGNSALETTEYSVSSRRLPEGFEGFRIAQISDLHNTAFGNGNAKLLADNNVDASDYKETIDSLADSGKTPLSFSRFVC